jgi:hypothetical protein
MSALANRSHLMNGTCWTMPRITALVALGELAKEAYGPGAFVYTERDENGYVPVSLWRPDRWGGESEPVVAFDGGGRVVLLDDDGEWRDPEDTACYLTPRIARWGSVPPTIVWEASA